MRRYIVLAAVAGMAGLFAEEALARKVAISGRHSPAEIKATCAAVGGYYNSGSGGYGCTKADKGTDVTCKKGKCVGIVPRQAPGGSRSVGGLLGTRTPGASPAQRRASDSRDKAGVTARGDRRVATPAISADSARPQRGGPTQRFGGGNRRH